MSKGKRRRISDARAELSARINRTSHPSGYFDDRGRWKPDEKERQECCNGLKPRGKYDFMFHCRSYEHIAHMFNVDVEDIREGNVFG